jgi:putative DNA primase/helicase
VDVLKAWLATCSGAGNNESRQILEKVADFIERHGDGRFSDPAIESAIPTRDRAGWWRDEDGQRFYLFTAAGIKEALKGFDFKRALDELQRAGALPPSNKNGERAKAERLGGRLVKVYAINPEMLGAHHES